MQDGVQDNEKIMQLQAALDNANRNMHSLQMEILRQSDVARLHADAFESYQQVSRVVCGKGFAEINELISAYDQVKLKLQEYESAKKAGMLARIPCRCKDCDLWNSWDSVGCGEAHRCSCAYWTVEDGPVLYTGDDDYCGNGERKSEE